MPPVELRDTVALEGTRLTRDGYLVADCRVTRTGVQLYAGAEVGRPDLSVVRVWRPEDEVFAEAAMRTAAYRPITDDHPAESVTAANWKALAVGFTGGEVARDGAFLRVPLMLADAAAIEAVQAGKRELSAGYLCDIEWASGRTPEGEAYDAVQRNIRINHFAVVSRGRAGRECRIGDEGARRGDAGAPGGGGVPPSEPAVSPETGEEDRHMAGDLRTVVVDGLTIDTTVQGAQVIERLQQRIADLQRDAAETLRRAEDQVAQLRRDVESRDGQIRALQAQHRRDLEAKDGEIAGLRTAHQRELEAKDGEIAALKAQLDPAALDARVAARAALVAQARKVLGDAFDPSGKTDAEIRRAVVLKAMPNLQDADKRGEAFFDAAFEAVVAMAPRAAAAAANAQPHAALRSAIATPGRSLADAVNAAHGERTEAWRKHRDYLATAWRGGAVNTGQEAR